MENTPGTQCYSASQLPFLQWRCSVATSERTVFVLGGSWWKSVKQKGYSAVLFIWSDDIGEVGSGQEHGGRTLGTEQKGGSYGTADTLRHFKQSDGFPLISQRLQSSTEKGSHVEKKSFQLQPLELQCRTRVHTHIQKHTLAHKRVHMGLVRVQRLISVTTRVENKAGHLAHTLQLSPCTYVKAK